MEFYQTCESTEEILCLLKKWCSYFCRNGPGARGKKKEIPGKTYCDNKQNWMWPPHRSLLSTCSKKQSNNWNLCVAIDLFDALRAQPETTAMLTEWGDVSVGPIKGRNLKGQGWGGVEVGGKWPYKDSKPLMFRGGPTIVLGSVPWGVLEERPQA